MMQLLSRISIVFGVWLLPAVAFAQDNTITGVVMEIGRAVGAAIPIAAALVLVAFFWGLAIYLFNFGEGKEDKQKQGRSLMLYSILAMFVMVTIWGIVGLLANSFGIDERSSVPLPKIDGLNPGGPGPGAGGY